MIAGVLALHFATLIFMFGLIVFLGWRSHALYKRVHGVAPALPWIRFEKFTCTLLLPRLFRAKRDLMASQPAAVRAEIERLARTFWTGLLIAIALMLVLIMAAGVSR